MSDIELARQLHVLLSESSSDQAISSFFEELDARIAEIAHTDDPQRRHDFQEGLQRIYDEDVDPQQLHTLEIFIEVLYHSKRIITPEAFISTWVDLILRPALKEPKLAPSSVEHAKELILNALEADNGTSEKTLHFRRRLVDLYLYDAVNESSEKEILDWAYKTEDEKRKEMWWKQNLRDILVRFGTNRPEDFLSVLDDCFQNPDSRLQILEILDFFVNQPSFFEISNEVTSHKLMDDVLRSLEVDNSATVCNLALAVVEKQLPSAAIKMYDTLKDMLPRLYAVLARMLCWKPFRRQRGPQDVTYADLLDSPNDEKIKELEERETEDVIKDAKKDGYRNLKVREELEWQRLEHAFDASVSSAPVPRRLFAVLYYLFPCNTIQFLRRPLEYINERSVESPWTVPWEEALDELQIRSAGASLLHTYATHPSMIYYDAKTEIEDDRRFQSFDVPQIIGEILMLDTQNFIPARLEASLPTPPEQTRQYTAGSPFSDLGTPTARSLEIGGLTPTARTMEIGAGTPTMRSMEIGGGRHRRVSLQDIVATNLALKSGNEISTSERPSAMASALFTPRSGSPLVRTLPLVEEERIAPSSTTQPVAGSVADESSLPTQIVTTISSLQREVLLLRTEVNFELFLKRANIKHISRLHEDKVLRRNAEIERQRLHDRLREYRTKVVEQEKQLKEYQDQAKTMKKKYEDWNVSLSSKLTELREQKKEWMKKINELTSGNNELQKHLRAQSELMAKAKNEIFDLKTDIKKDKHKVDRLRDYEKRIEQLTGMLKMWNKDIRMYNEQSQLLSNVLSEHEKLKLRIDSFEKTQAKMEEEARASRRRIASLEAQLKAAQRTNQRMSSDRPNPTFADKLRMSAAEKDALAKKNQELRRENNEMQQEIEELNAMVEMLKAQVKGTVGLVYPDGDRSPQL